MGSQAQRSVPVYGHLQWRQRASESGGGIIGKWGGLLKDGQPAPSHQLGSLGERCKLPVGSMLDPQTPNSFAVLKVLKVASPATFPSSF